MPDPTGLKDFLTIGCAVLGAGLGILNTLTNLNQRRVKLRVTPKLTVRSGPVAFSHKNRLLPDGVPTIEVINLSAFPVTIAEAGFRLKRESGRLAALQPCVIDNKPWPRRLESREMVTVYFPPGTRFPSNLHLAYATTDCEITRYGDSPALKKFRAYLHRGS